MAHECDRQTDRRTDRSPLVIESSDIVRCAIKMLNGQTARRVSPAGEKKVCGGKDLSKSQDLSSE